MNKYVLAVLMPLTLLACSRQAPSAPAPAVVIVATPQQQKVVDWDDYAGRFEAVESVEVRPRVSGLIQSVHFADGDRVRQGQLMFVIDPRPYAALLSRSQAQVAGAKAALVNADSELKRASQLVASHAISASHNEALVAAQLRAASDLAAAQATVEAQQLDLSFTRVTAPITGRASYRRLAAGNMVTSGSTLLTTIVSENPIHFVFDVPESALLKYKRDGATARANSVLIRLEDEAEYRLKGSIDFLDNAIDAGSGTIRARAVLDNSEGLLTPGMFGRMRLLATQSYDALLVPDQAIVTDQTRQVVYVVGADNIVAQRTIEPGRLIGGLRVIRAGVSPDDRVVISGMQRARPGRKVTPNPGAIEAFPTGVSRGENTSLTAVRARAL